MSKTIFQVLMQSPPTGKPKPTKPTTESTATAKPKKSRELQVQTGVVDAMKLSPDDYRARLRQLGLDAPNAAPTPYRPMGANQIESQRALDESRRSVDRAGRNLERQRERVEQERLAELQPGSFDARTATPEEVRARYAQIGVDASPANIYVRETGQPLAAPTQADRTHEANAQRESDRLVARRVHEATQRGESVNVKKLSAGEFAALMEIRGGGGYEPAR